MKRLALMAVLGVVGCQWVPGTDAHKAEAAKSLVREELFDGDSARFENVVVSRSETGKVQVCGWVNAKNRYGAYVGPERFLVDGNRVAGIGAAAPPEFGACVALNEAARERMQRDVGRALDTYRDAVEDLKR